MFSYPAPAKLNLFLHVVGQRADGYHLLQTVFRFIDWADTLHFAIRDDGQIEHLNPLAGVPPETDLCVRAARLLKAHTACPLGVSIQIEKNLPMGGGLGGGSSDAATTLLALNHHWGLGLSGAELQTLGVQLGADVPIFIYGHSAFAEGIGEAFQPVSLPETWYVVLVPPVHVPTPVIFKSPDLVRNTPEMAYTEWPFNASLLHNDLEAVAVRLFPEVAEALTVLNAYAPARMTGSGACVFAEFSSQAAADEALKAILEKNVQKGLAGKVAKGVECHPLLALS